VSVIIRNEDGEFDAANDPRRPAGGAGIFWRLETWPGYYWPTSNYLLRRSSL